MLLGIRRLSAFFLCLALCAVAVTGGWAQECLHYDQYIHWTAEVDTEPAYDLAIEGRLALTVGLYEFGILDVTDPDAPVPLGAVDLLNGNGIVVRDNRAYVAAGGPMEATGRLDIVDISSPESPYVLDSALTPQPAQAVVLADSLLAVATGWAWEGPGMLLMMSPQVEGQANLIGSLELPDAAIGVAVAGNAVFVACSDSGLYVVDISDPAAMAIIGSNDHSSATDVLVRDGYAFVLSADGRLVVDDVSTPADPVFLNELPLDAVAYDLALDGDFVFLAGDPQGLLVVDISNPAVPVLIGGLDYFDASSIAVAAGSAFATERGGSLHVFDVSQVSFAPAAGRLSWTDDALDIALAGELAYLADGDGGVRIIDISEPGAPQIVNTIDTAERAFCLALDGDRAYVADLWPAVLYVFDIVDPLDVRLLGTLEFPGFSATDVAVAGNHAYLAGYCSGQVHCDALIVDVSVPEQPQLVGALPMSGQARGLAIARNYVFAAASNTVDGLQIFDVSQPEAPLPVGDLVTGGYPMGVVVAGDRAYLALASAGLMIIDVADPANPWVLSTTDTPGSVYDVALRGDLAYLADRAGGLQVVDLSDLARPQLLGALETPGLAYAVALTDRYAFLAEQGNGLEVAWLQCDPLAAVGGDDPGRIPAPLDLRVQPNPFNPRITFRFDLPQAGRVMLAIYDVRGARVATVTNADLPAGEQNLTWTGIGQDGTPVPSSVYFARLDTPAGGRTEKVTLVR